VKREPGGLVSNHLHTAIRIGDYLALFAPSGDFVLRDGDRSLVLISGAVGITPVMAMLQATVASHPKRPVTFIHAARHGDTHAFRSTTDAIARAHPQVTTFYCYDTHLDGTAAPHAVGCLDREKLERWLPVDRDVDAYLLGPTAFMRGVKRDLAALGVPASQTRYEFFGPARVLD
jgi:nitric oxide dioxygenase